MRLLVTLVITSIALAAMPVRAATTSVGFGLAAGTYAPTGAACRLSVPQGANGIAVLDAAVAKGCIRSYATQSFGEGTFIRCINEVCGDDRTPLLLTYWALYVDGVYVDFGVDRFAAGTHREMVFSYVTWLTCLTPLECDNQL